MSCESFVHDQNEGGGVTLSLSDDDTVHRLDPKLGLSRAVV